MREWARQRALEGRLLVTHPNWCYEITLDAEGRIVVDLDDGVVERPANAREVHLCWQAYIPRSWAELAAFVPPRPPEAVACTACGGAGLHPDPRGEHAHVTCICGEAGWIPPEAVGVDAFRDDAPVAAGNPDAPPQRQSLWRRWIEKFAP